MLKISDCFIKRFINNELHPDDPEAKRRQGVEYEIS